MRGKIEEPLQAGDSLKIPASVSLGLMGVSLAGVRDEVRQDSDDRSHLVEREGIRTKARPT
ncbi:hypothetical protein HNR46_003921 [Haloferula luteola]|uniref:Uncharacterized protein n=1 Tax=Haloferula luteola TaxID=595692 RepID=A0A840VII6_9BACT|nr:hypothetical protein [Haloferula luteola]MBB5353660.1 hypothetical protein [Haloferula luteola]